MAKLCPYCRRTVGTHRLYTREDNERIMGGGADYKSGPDLFDYHSDPDRAYTPCEGSGREV